MKDKLRPPIILIGNYRSGTSVTQNLIGLHSDIATWYEPRTVWLYPDPGRRHDEFDQQDASNRVVRYIRNRFLRHQQRHDGRRVMEKTPSNNLRVPFVDAIFPDAIYLHVTRNPFSFISSMEYKWQRSKTMKGFRRSVETTPVTQLPYYAVQMLKDQFSKKILNKKYISMYGPRYKGIDDDIKECSKLRVIAKQWAIANRRAREDIDKLDQSRVLSFLYEDLVKDPRGTFRRIYDHCDLEYDSDMLSDAENMVDPKRQQKWARFDEQQLKEILPEIEQEMEFYGYEVPSPLR